MAEKLTFTAWQRSKLFDFALPQGARLGSSIPLILTDTNTGQQTLPGDGNAPFLLKAAGDVAGIKRSAIKHMAPAPFTHDAETTKFVHIDLYEKDLPWRYTPRTVEDDHVYPWLVLLVGTGEEIDIKGNIANAAASVLAAHDLAESHLWAHTQSDGNSTIARILSPREILPQREYIAVLVPAFNSDGEWMWNAAGEPNFGSKGVLPAFHFWRFWTAEAGDFETLAAALHIPPAGDVGKAKLHYRRIIPQDGVNIDAMLEVRGAITSLQPEATPVDAIAAVRADLDLLNNEIPNSIGMPQYGRPWLPNPDQIPAGWPADLNDDPRYRSLAGLGLWMGVEAQEALMDAAVQQAGALREAGQRIGHLALGLLAAKRLWDRRIPTDKNERLHILGPLMGRMIASDGGLVLNRVTSAFSPLTPAQFSSAAQRLLRDRSPHTRHLATKGRINRSEAMDEANQPEALPDRVPAGLPHADTIAAEMGLPTLEDVFRLDTRWLMEVMDELFDMVRRVTEAYRRNRDELRAAGQEMDIPALRSEFVLNILMPELANQLQARLPEREMPCEGWGIIQSFDSAAPGGSLEYFGRVLEDDGAQQQFYNALWRALVRCMGERPCEENISDFGNQLIRNRETFCDDLLDSIAPEPRSPQRPINLGQLSDALYTALDPRRPDAPARLRLCSQLSGIDCSRLTRPEFPIGLDFPTWTLLKQYDKEWLLPGASRLENDSITALQTNPAFVDAYMVGINTQFLSEMRWRDLAVARTCTPLRMFWGQVNYATQKRQADIEPLGEWAKVTADSIGALSHQTIQPDDSANTSGSRLVIAFHTPLFRRYPSTLVYLVKPGPKAAGESDEDYESRVDALLKSTPKLDMPADVADIETWRKNRQFYGPVFAGNITPDLIFFAFDVTPSTLDQYWLVLDEPPAELRFRNDETPVTMNSATFAESMLDKPTRVAISGEELERQANNP